MADNKLKAERNRAVYEARESGAKYTDLAKEHGVSVTRVTQIWRKIDWQKRRAAMIEASQ